MSVAETTAAAAAAEAPRPEALSFLVIEQASSRSVPLPREGTLVIGRGEDADLRVDDTSVSRRHAEIAIDGGRARVRDLESRNGVRVNGATLAGERVLALGDVVSIGDVTLVLRGRARSPGARALLDADAALARLQQEIDRAVEFSRPVGVAVLALDAEPPALAAALDGALRGIDAAGRLAGGEIVLVFPELGPEEARAAASLAIERLTPHAPGVRAGVASCPADGCDAETLLAAARDACSAVRAGVAADDARVVSLALGDRHIVLADPSMIRLFSLIERLAAADLPVLVVGETGAGKEHAAFAVHHHSPRRAGPFVSVNCAAIPETLFESELFGHERGAFSGAHAAKIGMFERASGGTLFLDEVGELGLAAQAKLLRALEGGGFTRLGDTRERHADVRVVAATNRDLRAEVKARRFREDLFYRLGSAVVQIPPLRERPADIPVLARRFLGAARARTGKGPLTITPAAMLALARHAWPGNVRELRNAMEYVAASVIGSVAEPSSLPATITGEDAPRDDRAPEPAAAALRPIAEEIEELERRRMREALAAAGGVKIHAARLISMPERTFRLKLRQYGLDRGRDD